MAAATMPIPIDITHTALLLCPATPGNDAVFGNQIKTETANYWTALPRTSLDAAKHRPTADSMESEACFKLDDISEEILNAPRRRSARDALAHQIAGLARRGLKKLDKWWEDGDDTLRRVQEGMLV